MRWVAPILGLLALVLLQTSSIPAFELFGVAPNVLLVMLCCWAVVRDQEEAMLLVPLAGIFIGLLSFQGTAVSVAALLGDLKRRGLLDSTLVVFSGEFGRTPFREGRTSKGKVLGRDHYPDCYSMFMAGGGLKGGISYGESDDLGFRVAENPVHVHDLQATILHLLGFDHEHLDYRFQGRDYRLTDVFGEVRHDLLA